MKKSILLIVLGLLTIANINAKEKVKGLLINGSDTLNIFVEVPTGLIGKDANFLKLQRKITIWNTQGKKQKIKPSQANEIRFDINGETIRMVSANYDSKSKLFLKLEIEGFLSMYKCYYTEQTGGQYGAIKTEKKYVLNRDDEVYNRPIGIFSKKALIEFFNDCPELASKIRNGEFKEKNMKEIVSFYNKNCR
jgi:hypothetical protein